MKNILIPSDFSIQSLDCIKELLSKFKDDRLTIVFIHVFLLTDSISELMLLSRRRKEYDYVSRQFWDQCKKLEREHCTRIHSIQVKCFYGSTVAVFKNFLEGHGIDLIVYPAHYQFRKLSKRSVDPTEFIAKCGREVMKLSGEVPAKEVRLFTWVRHMSYQLSPN